MTPAGLPEMKLETTASTWPHLRKAPAPVTGRVFAVVPQTPVVLFSRG